MSCALGSRLRQSATFGADTHAVLVHSKWVAARRSAKYLGGFESATPSVREFPVYDPKDPTTYTVRHRYGDVDITVSADLNIQGEYDGSAPAVPPGGIVVEAAGRDEPPIARVTLYKFRIPYVIDVECGSQHATLCRNEKQLRALAERLALVSVPKQ